MNEATGAAAARLKLSGTTEVNALAPKRPGTFAAISGVADANVACTDAFAVLTVEFAIPAAEETAPAAAEVGETIEAALDGTLLSVTPGADVAVFVLCDLAILIFQAPWVTWAAL
jgi:hypothetical protein